MSAAHVSLVTLGVADLERTERFYVTLGWRRSSASVPGTVVFLRGGAMVLSLFGRDELAADAGLRAGALATSPAVVTLACNPGFGRNPDGAVRLPDEA